MQAKLREQHFFYAFLAAIAVFCAIILWPFFSIGVVSIALAVSFTPINTFIRAKLGGPAWLAALLVVLLFIVVIGIPLFFIGSKVLTESQSIYLSIIEGNGGLGFVDGATAFLKEKIPMLGEFDLRTAVGNGASAVAGTLASAFTATISTAFGIFLILLSLFYFLKDGQIWKKYIVKLSPLSDMHDERILAMLQRAVNGVMRGYVLIAAIQGLLMGFGLWIFGVPNATLWGVFAGIASMVPTIGTALVSIPAIIYLFATGDTGAAIGLAAWSIALVGTVDNVLNPVVVGKQIHVPPVVVLFSVLGGIALLGAPGIIIGPLAVSLLHTLIQIYQEDFTEKEDVAE